MNVQPIRLGEYVEVLPGYALKAYAKHDPHGSHQIITGRHLPALDLKYRYRPEHALKLTPKGKVDSRTYALTDALGYGC